jgi:hypothetical protein
VSEQQQPQSTTPVTICGRVFQARIPLPFGVMRRNASALNTAMQMSMSGAALPTPDEFDAILTVVGAAVGLPNDLVGFIDQQDYKIATRDLFVAMKEILVGSGFEGKKDGAKDGAAGESQGASSAASTST